MDSANDRTMNDGLPSRRDGDIATGANVATPGQALALPMAAALAVIRAVMADAALTPAQARAVAAVVCQANSATGCAWTSYRQLREATGLGFCQISAGLKAAIGRYLVEATKGNHGAVCYRILVPKTPTSAPTVVALPDEIPAASAPAMVALPQCSATAAVAPDGAALPVEPRSATKAVAILDYTGEEETTPPTPPQTARGGSVSFLAQDSAQDSASAEDPNLQSRIAEPEVLANGAHQADKAAIQKTLDSAHEAVFGVPMPLRWKRRLDAMNGSAACFANVTAADIRAAMAKAKEQKRSFGFGWVERLMLDKAALVLARNAAALAKQRAAEQAAENAGSRSDTHQAQQAENAQEAQRAEWFATLSETRQEEYRQRVRQMRFAPMRRELIDAQAALAAWRDEHRETER